MEAWRRVFRQGLATQFSSDGLRILLKALLEDSQFLIQGATTSPPPLQVVVDLDCTASDAIAFVGWRGEGLRSVGEVEEFFAKACYNCDLEMNEPAVVRFFLDFYDDTPRNVMRSLLSEEIRYILASRLPPMSGPLPTVTRMLQECAKWARANGQVTPALIDAFIESGFVNIARNHFEKGGCDESCLCITYAMLGGDSNQSLQLMERGEVPHND